MHKTFLYVYKLESSRLAKLQRIQLTFSPCFGTKCHYKSSKVWTQHENSIYYFKFENQKYSLYKLNLETNEIENTTVRINRDIAEGKVYDVQFCRGSASGDGEWLQSSYICAVVATGFKNQRVYVNSLDLNFGWLQVFRNPDETGLYDIEPLKISLLRDGD